MMKALLLTATAAFAFAFNSATAADSYTIDPEKSEVTFSIMNKPPGAKEASKVDGKFNEFSGTVVFDAEDASKTSISIEIKASSVDTGNTKRDDHLRNQDFFKVKEHPTLTFKSTEVSKTADGEFEVKGDFTLLGVTKPVTVTVKKEGDNTATTSFQIKRSDYGMSYRVPDTADEVDVTLKFVGNKE